MSAEWFWTIISYGVILGIGGVVGFVFFYWLVVIPQNVVGPHGRRR
jgi:hypothetical protein